MRLFVGLSLPNEVRQSLSGLCTGLDGARWVNSENLHMTLRFVGEIGGGEAGDLDAVLGAVSAPEFDLQCRGIGHFGKAAKVRAIWAGLGPCPPLARLQEKVESAVARAGFGAEGRKFKPHITLVRFRRRPPRSLGAYMEANGAFSTPPFSVNAFTLFESHMGHGGSHYVALKDYRLDPVDGRKTLEGDKT